MAKVLKIGPVILVLFISFLGLFTLIHPGLPPTHDGEYHVVRFWQFYKVLSDGVIYPRWAPDFNNGYGIPLFTFVYPLPNYIASLFHLSGISFIDGFKLNMLFAGLVGTFFFYLWSKKHWGTLGAVIATTFYSFAPYRFVDIYVRGSVGELWSMAFFPGFLWTIDNYFQTKQRKYVLFSSILLALVIFSHNILGLMFFVFVLFYIAFLIIQQKNRKPLILSSLFIILSSLFISSIFWLPALLETKYTLGLQIFNIKSHFPELYQLLIPSWGTGFSGNTSLSNQMSFQIGIANLLAVIVSFFVVFKIKDKKKKEILILFLASFLIIFFLMLRPSLFLWQKIPLLNYFQFPWRFLSLEILICGFLAGSFGFFLEKIKTKYIRLFLTALVLIFVIFLSISYAHPPYYLERVDNYYLTRSNFVDGTNSPGNSFNTIWFKKIPKAKSKISVISGEATVKTEILKSNYYKFGVDCFNSCKIQINTAYFPGWNVYVNEKKRKVNLTKQGLFSFNLEKGKYLVEARFTDTIYP